ncbi:selenium metabolism hydrolase [Sporosarcina sp. P37]|uniref:YgeY family selenium metabolism-linked hydrolase n=1 Tax=unclassified Sporosarcina TaxID=2647733 RepID=UPI0009BF6D3C|nr:MULTISPECIES: YgeY family selenium metabolism-linked hydrolase [unclassified Sporosarcina]ARD47383.1 hypothetical protein SporoP33_03350 [Sporosarcina sp. P33]ARK23952.1 selenium metabolism hydrolase [Sporosarcina sp. P37]PID17267.1 YgeY family selenium metabolism-linked hydrolase [Sporosarcina sp. P35]
MIVYDELIQLTQQAVQIQSYSGEEHAVAELLYNKMQDMGYDECWIDAYGNVIGKINGSGEGQSVLFDGHMDTVPINSPEKWTYDPFGAEIADGKMYGRGTSDMKGAICAAVIAGGTIARQIKQNGIRPKGDIYVSCSVYEEIFEGGALGKVIDQVHPDIVIIMEPSALQLSIGQLGRAEIIISSHGKSAHSSQPESGVNAIYELLPMLEALQSSTAPFHEKLGKGITVVTDIKSSPYPGVSIVPDLCTITIDRRLLVGETEEDVLASYQQLISLNENYSFEVAEVNLPCFTGEILSGKRFFPGWLLDSSHPAVPQALRALESVGQSPSLTTYKFCTNGSYSAGVAKIPTLGYGPSNASLVHIVDEYIEIEQLTEAAEGFVSLANYLTNLPKA